MGDIADYYMKDWDYTDIPENDFKRWCQGNGKRIKLTNMTEEHINNCLKKIVNDCWRKEWFTPLVQELIRRKKLHK